jgi:hypothetical protein
MSSGASIAVILPLILKLTTAASLLSQTRNQNVVSGDLKLIAGGFELAYVIGLAPSYRSVRGHQ